MKIDWKRQRRRIKELGRSGYDDEDDEYRIRRQRGPKLKKKNDILVPKGPVELLLLDQTAVIFGSRW